MRKIFCKENKKLNKKGFTLVEMLACVAILSIIALLLAEIVASSSNAYKRLYSTTEVQESCIESLTQISNIVRNSKSLTVRKQADGVIRIESKNYEGKYILVVYVPDADEADNYGKIYVDYDHDETNGPVGEGEEVVDFDITSDEKFLLTDMVTNFAVERSKYKKVTTNEDGVEVTEEVAQKKTLDFSLTLQKRGKTYTQNYKASVRNENPNTINIYDNTNGAQGNVPGDTGDEGADVPDDDDDEDDD